MGVRSAIGDFTKYEKKTLTFPNANSGYQWSDGAIVPCSFEPQIIVFYGGDTSQNGNIICGVLAFAINSQAIGVGGAKVRNANGVSTQYAYYQNPNASSQRFKYDSGNVYINCAVIGSVSWSNSDEYTFEIYG